MKAILGEFEVDPKRHENNIILKMLRYNFPARTTFGDESKERVSFLIVDMEPTYNQIQLLNNLNPIEEYMTRLNKLNKDTNGDFDRTKPLLPVILTKSLIDEVKRDFLGDTKGGIINKLIF